MQESKTSGTDAREPLDEDALDERTRLFTRLDPALLDAIAHSYRCTLLRLRELFKNVFLESADTQAGPAGPGSKPTGSAWLNVALGLAKLDVTKIAAVEATNLYLALKVLDEQIRQADELEKRLENARKS